MKRRSVVDVGRGAARRLVGLALVWLVVGEASAALAQEDDTGRRFVLGLKDPALRNEQGAQALADRLRERLLAARLTEHRIKVDPARGEVEVRVHAPMSPDELRALLTERGQLELVSAAPDPPELGDLRELLPPEVGLGLESGGQGVFLQANDRAALERFVGGVALSDRRLLVGPMPSGELGVRTWVVEQNTGWLGSRGLKLVTLSDGAHPNYHHLTACWGEAPEPHAAAPELEGEGGMLTLLQRAQGRKLLVVVDGRLELVLTPPREPEDGCLPLRLPRASPQAQLSQGRRLAALLASPHPCAVVVVREEEDR